MIITIVNYYSIKNLINSNINSIYKENVNINIPGGFGLGVTFDKGDEHQKVLNVCSNNVQTIKVTAESGKTQTYTITFIVQRSESAFLKMIYLDGKSLADFDKNTFDYTVSLTQATCPKITVDKEEGQQVTIATPYAAGQAQITVKPYGAEGNVYTIDFEGALTENQALLQQIYVDGVALANFESHKFEYTINYQGTFPVVTCDTLEGQEITTFRNGNVVTLYVVNGTDNAQYQLVFSTELSNDCSLKSILVGGIELASYQPTIKHYTIAIPAGEELPMVHYIKSSEQQVVHAGMTNASTYNILVFAENGDSTSYTLHFDKEQYSDATLLDLIVEGHSIDFDPNTFEYTLNLTEEEEIKENIEIINLTNKYK